MLRHDVSCVVEIYEAIECIFRDSSIDPNRHNSALFDQASSIMLQLG